MDTAAASGGGRNDDRHIQHARLNMLPNAGQQRPPFGAGKAHRLSPRRRRRWGRQQLRDIARVDLQPPGDTHRIVPLSVVVIRLPPPACRRRFSCRDIDLPPGRMTLQGFEQPDG